MLSLSSTDKYPGKLVFNNQVTTHFLIEIYALAVLLNCFYVDSVKTCLLLKFPCDQDGACRPQFISLIDHN